MKRKKMFIPYTASFSCFWFLTIRFMCHEDSLAQLMKLLSLFFNLSFSVVHICSVGTYVRMYASMYVNAITATRQNVMTIFAHSTFCDTFTKDNLLRSQLIVSLSTTIKRHSFQALLAVEVDPISYYSLSN